MVLQGIRWWFPVREWNVDDGISIRCTVDLGYNVLKRVKVSLHNIDMPRKATPEQREAALVGMSFVEYWLEAVYVRCVREGINMVLASNELDSFGCSLGDFIPADNPMYSLNDFLLKHEVAVHWEGHQHKWTTEELEAIKAKSSIADALHDELEKSIVDGMVNGGEIQPEDGGSPPESTVNPS